MNVYIEERPDFGADIKWLVYILKPFDVRATGATLEEAFSRFGANLDKVVEAEQTAGIKFNFYTTSFTHS